MSKLSAMFLFSMVALSCTTQKISVPYISTIDIVKCSEALEKEALYYYEQNWKAFRAAALDKGFISGYQLLRTPTDSTSHFNLILITEYPDSTSYSQLEENFQSVMKKISPNGPKMLNDVKRSDFLEYVAGYEARPQHTQISTKR